MKFTKEHQRKNQELSHALVQKAWESESFKEKLVKNPVAAISEYIGKDFVLPEGKKLVVRDQTNNENTIYLDIPAKPNLNDFELTDEELEVVAGGSDVIAGIAFVSLAFASYMYFK